MADQIVTHCASAQNIFLHILSHLTSPSCAEFSQHGSLSSLKKPSHGHDALRTGGDIACGIKGEGNAAENRGTLWRGGVNAQDVFFGRPVVSPKHTLTIPISGAKKMISKNIPAAFPQNKSSLMLIVEDSPTAQRALQLIIESLGFEADLASTGEEAIALFQPGKYVTLWTDVGLPDFDGYEVARRVRQMEQGSGFYVPIIGVSAHAPNDLALNAAAGINIMMTKPLRPDQAKALLMQYGVL